MSNESTPSNSIRVWAGFKLPTLSSEEFYKALGDTFIPGTLFMLRPLGVCAYNIAVVKHDSADLPGECALVVYKSRNAYRAITRENLSGRVHRASHFAVFDMQKSRAVFPDKWNEESLNAESYYLFDADVDWQKGFIIFCLITIENDGSNISALSEAVKNVKSYLNEMQCKQCILLQREKFATLWLYFETELSLSQIDEMKNAINKLIEEKDLRIERFIPTQTFPSFTDHPELMNISSDLSLQFRFEKSKNSFLY